MNSKTLSMIWFSLALFTALQCYIHTQLTNDVQLTLVDSLRWGALNWLPWIAITPLLLKHLTENDYSKPLTFHKLKKALFAAIGWGAIIGLLLSIDSVIQEGSSHHWIGFLHQNVLRTIPITLLTLMVLGFTKAYLSKRPSIIQEHVSLDLEKPSEIALPVPIERISHICACGNYIEVYTIEGEKHLLRCTMKKIEEGALGTQLVRIHRRCIVSTEAISDVKKTKHGDFIIKLIGNIEVSASRSYASVLKQKYPQI